MLSFRPNQKQLEDQLQRREFITLIGGASLAGQWVAHAQQADTPVIGYLSSRSEAVERPMLSVFRQGLAGTGYAEGRNVAIEFQWADGDPERLRPLAEDFVRRRVAVIVAAGGDTSILAAKGTTSTIPIVMNSGGDPVRLGLIASLNRPGGNVTGINSFRGDLLPKQLGLLHELVPKVSLLGALFPSGPSTEAAIANIRNTARAIGVRIIDLTATTDAQIEAAFPTFTAHGAGAVLVNASPFFASRQDKLVALAARYALPTMYFRREMVDAGGLISYGSDSTDGYHTMGVYAGRILRGERPAELPVVQPTKFELVLNRKTASALGLDIPLSVLDIVNEVIE
jgi:putative tryptophan/tyrosine transport system substrate-binding protein